MAKEIKPEELTKEQIEKALRCKNADELLALAKAEGYELTKDEAEAYMAELADCELNEEELRKAAGGMKWCWKAECNLRLNFENRADHGSN